MRLLFVQETDWLLRNPAQQHHLAEMMSLRGHEIRAIDYEVLWRTQDKKGFYSQEKVFTDVSKIHQGAGVTVIRPGIIKIPGLDYVSVVFSHRNKISRQMKEFRPDAVVGWGILSSYLAEVAAMKFKVPFIYYWIDVPHRLIPFAPFRPCGKLVESIALKKADRVLVINDKLGDYVISLGAKRERTHVVRAGIYLERFDLNIDGNTVRKQYGLNKEDFVLFFMGWLYQFSGLKEVAQQLAQTKDDSLKLLIVGEGDAYNDLQQIRERYDLQDRLILTGKKPYQEIPNYIAAADICLLPAYPVEKIMQDIVPIKMYEYMAMLKPVIATRFPGIMKEFGEDNGVLYINRPEEAVAKAIELKQNGSIKEFGRKARKFAERNSWHAITDEFERILNEVIKEKHEAQLSQRV
jgi:glycosyltransferase involved in cell wall biosynthesis